MKIFSKPEALQAPSHKNLFKAYANSKGSDQPVHIGQSD